MPSKELPQTSYAVLGLLSFQPMSGYDVKQFADRSISHFYWSPAKSQVYAELRRLKGEGLVTEEHVEQDTRPDKRIYAITPEGRTRLSNWLNSGELELDVFKSALMLKLFLGKSAGINSLITLVEQNLAANEEKLAMLEGMEQNCLAPEHEEHDTLFSLVTIRAGIHLTKASIAWSKETLDGLKLRAAGESL